jgi:hypothetical protein
MYTVLPPKRTFEGLTSRWMIPACFRAVAGVSWGRRELRPSPPGDGGAGVAGAVCRRGRPARVADDLGYNDDSGGTIPATVHEATNPLFNRNNSPGLVPDGDGAIGRVDSG